MNVRIRNSLRNEFNLLQPNFFDYRMEVNKSLRMRMILDRLAVMYWLRESSLHEYVNKVIVGCLADEMYHLPRYLRDKISQPFLSKKTHDSNTTLSLINRWVRCSDGLTNTLIYGLIISFLHPRIDIEKETRMYMSLCRDYQYRASLIMNNNPIEKDIEVDSINSIKLIKSLQRYCYDVFVSPKTYNQEWADKLFLGINIITSGILVAHTRRGSSINNINKYV